MPENKNLNILINTKYEGKGLTDLRKDFNDNKKTLDELRRTNQQTSQTYKNLIKEQGDLSRTISGLTREYKGLAAQQKMSKFQMLEFGENLTIVGAGIGMLVNKVGSFVSASMDMGSALTVLQSNFKGSARDIELFRQATAGTVTDANLIKLSNQATDLGISLQNQAVLFSLAEDAGDKYGGNVEENIQRVVLAIAKNGRGLEQLGITTVEYKKVFDELIKSKELDIDTMSEETRVQVGFEAITKITGLTLADVSNKTQDVADKMQSLKVQQEEVKTAFGQGINIVFEQLYKIGGDIVKMINDMTGGSLKLVDAARMLGEALTSAVISPLMGIMKLLESIENNPLLSIALNGIGRGGGVGGINPHSEFPKGGNAERQGRLGDQASRAEKASNETFKNTQLVFQDVNNIVNLMGISQKSFFTDFLNFTSAAFSIIQSAQSIGGVIGFFGKALSFLGLAGGGQAIEGRPYIVGEQGREMFVPNTTGQIINTMDLKSLTSGSSASPVNITINTDLDFIRFNKVMNSQVKNFRQNKLL